MFLGSIQRLPESWHLHCHLQAYCLEMWEPRRLTVLWASTTCYRDSFALQIQAQSVSWNLRAWMSLQY
jgi:hypothetical protein